MPCWALFHAVRTRLDSADAALVGRHTHPRTPGRSHAVVRRKFRPVNLVTLLPFIVLIGAMFLMTRSAKKKQQQAAQMRNDMQPGTGVRTIGGMYATVKEVNEDTVLLEVAPGVHAALREERHRRRPRRRGVQPHRARHRATT